MHRVVAIIAVPSLLILAIGLVFMNGPNDNDAAASGRNGAMQFQSGDTVVIASDQVELRRGTKTITRLGKDRQLVVSQVQGSWVGGNVMVDGQKLTGWVHARDLRLLERGSGKPSEGQPADTAAEAVEPPSAAEPSGNRIAFPVSQEPRETLGDKFARIMAEERAAKAVATSQQEGSTESPASAAASQESAEVEVPKPELLMRVAAAQNPEELLDLRPLQLIGRLVIIGDQFSNRSLKQLDGMRILSLSIEAVNINNAGLLHVTRVKNLQELRLWTPGVSDSGLEIIAKMSDLEILDLEGTSVQGAALAQLSGLARLSKLTLGPKTGDEAVALLPKLAGLEQVDLRSCYQLTEACIPVLAGLERLKEIWLPSHLVTAGEQAIRKANPRCQIRS